ncbi:hypothetical protein NP554_22365 [Pseudomonas asiatica]|uniref:Uncharacterized protein n=2 Tax=Pseudomonas TaxID=286 RepID=A0A9X4DIW7_9PSED|nr:hypothetical protein [Pseudomonas asiatica]MDD2114529.1 hypothetical protein [Pseudomonas asiatica]MEE1909179.1 hypothetical protein [Pseudomonas inefficax]MEE1985584.1 hypothetical protein [Pseudomonas inefficax]WJN49337.1 hypothetical protein QUR91_22205 [Pseudomonas asiatica]
MYGINRAAVVMCALSAKSSEAEDRGVLRNASVITSAQAKELRQVMDRLNLHTSSPREGRPVFLQPVSFASVLPSKSMEAIVGRGQVNVEANVFDQDPYRTTAEKNRIIEVAIGKGLATSDRLNAIAKAIRLNSGAPMRFGDFTPEQQERIRHESKNIGGAKELIADKDNLDAHVLATLIKAEDEIYNVPGMERRQCMFNHVRTPDNPIFPWNSHRFDLEIWKVNNPIQYPAGVANLIADRWNDLVASKGDEPNYFKDTFGIADHRDGILHILQGMEPSARKALFETLNVSWSTETFTDDEANSRDSNPLGSQFRQHTTGGLSNVVRWSDTEDKSVNQWVLDAVAHGKPVLSGPSGHTLRYLNHYAMCRELLSYDKDIDISQIPTLEEARLVMLGNLLPPKNHHSYHEIMLASVGVFDGEAALGYSNKLNYDDLKSTSIGSEILASVLK